MDIGKSPCLVWWGDFYRLPSMDTYIKRNLLILRFFLWEEKSNHSEIWFCYINMIALLL